MCLIRYNTNKTTLLGYAASPQLFISSLPSYHFCFVFKDPLAAGRQRTGTGSLELVTMPPPWWRSPFPGARKVSKQVAFEYTQQDGARKVMGIGVLTKNLNLGREISLELVLHVLIRERHEATAPGAATRSQLELLVPAFGT